VTLKAGRKGSAPIGPNIGASGDRGAPSRKQEPQSGSVPRPRVAARRLPWVSCRHSNSTLKGLCQLPPPGGTTPSGLIHMGCNPGLPQSGNPGLCDRTASRFARVCASGEWGQTPFRRKGADPLPPTARRSCCPSRLGAGGDTRRHIGGKLHREVSLKLRGARSAVASQLAAKHNLNCPA